MRDNKKREGLDKFDTKDEENNRGYVPLPFIASPKKKSNHLTDINKRPKSLNYLIYISKIGSLYNELFFANISKQRVFKCQKNILLAAYKRVHNPI